MKSGTRAPTRRRTWTSFKRMLIKINFLLFTLTQACKEFEERVGQLKSPRGEKTEAVLAAIDRQKSAFRIADLQADCPGVGLDLIRHILARLQKVKKVKAVDTGCGA